MTAICQDITGETIPIHTDPVTRPNDLIWYITDNARVSRAFSWEPKQSVKDTIRDIDQWLRSNRDLLSNIM
jgi:CDP-paratose 2-epimerase